MKRSRLMKSFALALVLVLLNATLVLAKTARVTDPGTTFHRIFIAGCGNDADDLKSIDADLADAKDALDASGKQANGSTSTTLHQPTQKEVEDAIAAALAKAKPPDEITFYYVGHGGGENTTNGGFPDDTDNEQNEDYDENLRMSCGDNTDGNRRRHQLDGEYKSGTTDGLFRDDELAAAFAKRPAGVTLVVILDACFGGGFTGGSDDLTETDEVKVIGTKGTCPGSSTGILDGLYPDTLSEDVRDGLKGDIDTNDDGIVSGDELKKHLEGETWNLGPTVDDPATGRRGGRCADPAEQQEDGVNEGCDGPDVTPVPQTPAPSTSFDVHLGGFLPGLPIEVFLLDPQTGERTSLGAVTADDEGAAQLAANVGLAEGFYGIEAVQTGEAVGLGTVTVRRPDAEFSDARGTLFGDEIEMLRILGAVNGCSAADPSRFCPAGSLTRGQMASLMASLLRLPATAEDFFSDDDGSVHEPSINALAAAGVTGGCSEDPPRYCPGRSLTRGQMAALLANAFDLLDPPGWFDPFTDDDASVFESHIERLAWTDVTTGCAAGRFCGSASLTRAQFAAFAVRMFSLNAAGTPTPAKVDTDGDGEPEDVVGDPGADSGQTPVTRDTDADNDSDEITVGTKGGDVIHGGADVDGDGDDEIIIGDPDNGPGTSPLGGRTDADPDEDVLWVGTKGGGKVKTVVDLDGDGDDDVIIEDPTLEPGQTRTIDLDGDGDWDLIWVGTKGGVTCLPLEDVDGDGESEIVLADPTLETGRTREFNMEDQASGADSDPDVVWRGTAPPEEIP